METIKKLEPLTCIICEEYAPLVTNGKAMCSSCRLRYSELALGTTYNNLHQP